MWVKCSTRPLWYGERERQANVNRVKSGEGVGWGTKMVPNNNRCVHLAAVTKSCLHSPNTHMSVYTLKAKTRTHTETEWIMSTHQSRDFSYCHTSLTSLYSLIWLGDLCLFRNEKQVWWMEFLYDFALRVPIGAFEETETNLQQSDIRKMNPCSTSGWSNLFHLSGQE